LTAGSSRSAGGGSIELIRIMVTPLGLPEIPHEPGYNLGTGHSPLLC
jgi:hypothetical protein